MGPASVVAVVVAAAVVPVVVLVVVVVVVHGREVDGVAVDHRSRGRGRGGAVGRDALGLHDQQPQRRPGPHGRYGDLAPVGRSVRGLRLDRGEGGGGVVEGHPAEVRVTDDVVPALQLGGDRRRQGTGRVPGGAGEADRDRPAGPYRQFPVGQGADHVGEDDR